MIQNNIKKKEHGLFFGVTKLFTLGFLACMGLNAQAGVSAQLWTPDDESEAQLINEELEAQQAARLLEEEQRNFDHAMYSRVNVIRGEIGLENEDLAAMGCDQVKAKEILNLLKQWCITNATQIKVIHKAQAIANQKLHKLNQKINRGRSKDNLSELDAQIMTKITATKDNLKLLHEQHEALDNTAKVIVSAVLTTSQLNAWQAILANLGQNKQYRYIPDITAAQRESLSAIRTQFILAGTLQSQTRGTSLSWMTSSEENVLTAAQRTAAAACHVNLTQYKQSVLDAIESVFKRE